VTTASKRRVSARLAAIAPSATLAVDAKAKALKAAGEPIIGFGPGEPNFPTPENVVEAAVAAFLDGQIKFTDIAKTVAHCLSQDFSDGLKPCAD